MVTVFGVITLLCLGLSVFNTMPGWAVAIPVVVLVTFLVSARAGVGQVHRRLDRKAVQVKVSYADDESISMMKTVEEEETSREFSVNLTMPETIGPLWDLVPVIAPIYVSKSLMLWTVRTIDLSAPVANTVATPTISHLEGPKPRRAAPANWDMEEESHRPRTVGQ